MQKLLAAALLVLLVAACAKGSDFERYRSKLREYSRYSSGDTDRVGFSYSASDEENLQQLKQKYDLPTIAGHEDELSRITNLMLWVNKNIPHDGSSRRIVPPNADNIIATCQSEDRGANCRMLSTVLNEFYLAMGFKSRFVTCKPFEHDFDDCHVVNAVYSTQLGKWIMMDPSFAGYFKDEHGDFLGLSEARERLTKGEALAISDSLNRNGGRYTKHEYRTYMAKNLFRLSCPQVSEYNHEARGFRQYVELTPLGYEPEGFNNYTYTTSPTAFWEQP